MLARLDTVPELLRKVDKPIQLNLSAASGINDGS